MDTIKKFLNRVAELASQALAKIKLGGVAKAVVAAVAPFVLVWVETGDLDEKAIGTAVVTAALVYWFPNLKTASDRPALRKPYA